MPRRTPGETRAALFTAGRALLEQQGAAAVTLEDVARAAGVTRQTVYLYFGSRARFLLELSEAVGGEQPFVDAQSIVRDAPSAASALRQLIALRAASSAAMYPYIAALASAASADPDVAALWAARQARRRRVYLSLARRLSREGMLRRGVPVRDAAEVLSVMLSFENWKALVHGRRWPAARYVRRMEQLVTHGLLEQ